MQVQQKTTDVFSDPTRYSIMERINAIAEGMAALTEKMNHVVDKVDKIDARTMTQNEQSIRQDMRLQAMHVRQDAMASEIAANRAKIAEHDTLIQQGKGAARLGHIISAIIGGILGAVGTIAAIFK